MADSNLQSLNEDTSPSSDDIIYVVNDPSGSPGDRKVTLANLAKGIDASNLSYSNSKYLATDIEGALDELGETKFWNGFDRQTSASLPDLSWDDGTRTFSCAVKSGSSNFYFWSNGKKYTKTTTQSVVVPDTTDTYYLIFDGTGTLVATPYASVDDDDFYENAIAGLVYWNKTAATGMAGYELHGIRMSATTHKYNHDTMGARYASGMDITGLVNGNDTYTAVASGVFWDEDIDHSVASHTSTPFIYRLGTDGEWTGTTADLNVSHNAGGSYDVWNENTGATWQLTEGTSSTDFWIIFLIATPDLGTKQYKKIIGQNAYSSRAKARNAIATERNNLAIDGLPSPEFVFLYAWIVKRNGDLIADADGNTYYDLRAEKGGVAGTSTSANLADDVVTDTSNFNGNLSSTDTTVQTALDTLDDATIPAKASGAELTTGTDDAKYATAKAIKDSHNVPSVAPGTSGNVLTSDGTDWTSAAASGGGSGQTLYDAVLDASGGGDYTDFSTALAALSAGDTLFVRSGTYTESATMSFGTSNVTIIGENMMYTIINLSNTSNDNWSAKNLTIKNLTFQKSNSGRWQLTGDYLTFDGCRIYLTGSAPSFALQQYTGIHPKIINNLIQDGTGYNDRKIDISGPNALVGNNNFDINGGSDSTTVGVINMNSDGGLFSGNVVDIQSTNTANAPVISLGKGTASGNTIDGNSTTNAVGFYASASTIISGNQINGCKTGVVCYGSDIAVTGNSTGSGGLGSGYFVYQNGGHRVVVTGNHIRGNASTVGVYLNGADSCSISGNVFYNFATGVTVNDSASDKNVIVGNAFPSCTTDVTDNGTGTVNANNTN